MEPVTNRSDPQTEPLLRLLALKRHEQPPPGYFDHFAAKVIARIEAAEAAVEGSWWRRLRAQFDARPMLACAYGVVVGTVLVLGVSFASSLDEQPTGAALEAGRLLTLGPAAPPQSADLAPDLAGPNNQPLRSSIHPVALGPPSFLLQGAPSEPQLVNWPRGGR